jgi:hypothetical protein
MADKEYAGLSVDQIKGLVAVGMPLDQIKDLAKAGFGYDDLEGIALALPKAGSGGGLDAKTLEDILASNTEAHRRAMKPENAFPPLISAFNPAGDRDHPRPRLKCEFTIFDAIPIDGTTETVEELELYNQLEPGEYFVKRTDESKMKFIVTAHKNTFGDVRRIDVSFPYKDESDRAGVMPMRIWLRDVVEQIAQRKEAHTSAA